MTQELSAQAIVNALTMQRNKAMDEAAQLAAMCAQMQQRITELEAQLKEKADGSTDPAPQE